MATKQSTREIAIRLFEGQIDVNSTAAHEMVEEIAERVLRLPPGQQTAS